MNKCIADRIIGISLSLIGWSTDSRVIPEQWHCLEGQFWRFFTAGNLAYTHVQCEPRCQPFDAHCCHMGTAIKHPVLDRLKPSFVIFDIWALWRSGLSVRVPGYQKYKWQLNPVWHRMLYSCTHMTRVGVKRLTLSPSHIMKKTEIKQNCGLRFSRSSTVLFYFSFRLCGRLK